MNVKMARPMDTEPRYRSGRLPFVLALGALFVTYVGVSAYYVAHGRTNHDEGWYLYAARLVYEGLLPYRDFAYFQAPLLPFIYGLPQKLFGGGVEVGRLTSFTLSVGTVALGTRLAFMRGGRLGAIFFLSIVCLTPDALWAFTTTRTEPLSAFLWMLSVFLLLGVPATVPRSACAFAVAVAAAGTRISSLPAAALVCLWVVLRHRGSLRQQAGALAPGLLLLGLLLAVAFQASPDVALFNVITAPSQRHERLVEAVSWSVGDHLESWLRSLNYIHSVFGVVPIAALGCTLAVTALWLTTRRRGATIPFASSAAALGAIAAAVYLPNLTPRAVFPVYYVGAYPLFVVLIAWCGGETFRYASRDGRRVVLAGFVAILLMQAATYAARYPRHLSGDESDLAELREVGDYLARVVPPEATLVTMDSYLAVESGRRLAPGWEMDIFSFFPRLDPQDARRYHVLSEESITQSLWDPSVGAVAFSDRALGLLIKRRRAAFAFYRELTEPQLHTVLPALLRYRLARVFPEFGQFRDRLYVMLPK